jgi:hypothetical protein
VAVPSGSHDAAVTKQILDGDNVCIGIEHLGGHGVPQLVAADIEAGRFSTV